MSIKAGLVGLPNVGKSTLFNALTKSKIAAQNFPFCTIEPNIAQTPVPDERLDFLAKVFGSKEKIPSIVKFVDIAGLVKGASKGEGLGNKFLSHIMEVDLIIHVLRCFEDDDIIHVSNRVDPLSDLEIIAAELMIKDLESIEKRIPKIEICAKKAKNSAEKTLYETELDLSKQVFAALSDLNQNLVQQIYAKAKEAKVELVPLLSTKNFLIAANFSEDEISGQKFEQSVHYQNLDSRFGREKIIPISAKIEAELCDLSLEEQVEMRQTLEMQESGLNCLVKKAYQELNLISFFTCGPKEAHSWSLLKGATAPQAGGVIHSDLERGFICAEVYNYQDMKNLGSEQAVKNAGKVKTEGRDYVVQDGDVIVVRFNV